MTQRASYELRTTLPMIAGMNCLFVFSLSVNAFPRSR